MSPQPAAHGCPTYTGGVRSPDGPAAAAGCALAFSKVSKRYRQGALALEAVTWSIRPGARACLLGPNGAGKSTAIRLLQGAIQPSSGEVRLLGVRVGGPGYAAARQRTGIVPQGPGMYTDVTTAEYLALARSLYGRGSLDRVVELFELGPHRDKMLAQLSGGFQRRVVLAAALLGEPTLLLLDEPTVGLDPVAAHDVRAFLREAMANRTTLLCTHNLAEAEALCDEVIILRGGRVLLHEPLASLRQRGLPQARLAARQGDAALATALRTRGLDPALDEANAGGVRIPVRDAAAEMPGLLRGLLADGLDIYECQLLQPTLERLFVDLVRSDA